MPTLTIKIYEGDGGAMAKRIEHPVDCAHYVRQATISLRRNSRRLNHAWYCNRHAHHTPPPWSH